MAYQLIWAMVVFLGLHTALRQIWVVWKPRSSIFWKQVDYVYFGFAVLGVVLGIADSVRNDLRLEAENAFAHRAELYRGLFVEVSATQKHCREHQEQKKWEERRESDKRFGIIRPPEEAKDKQETLFGFLPLYITQKDCVMANELYDAMIKIQAPVAKKLDTGYSSPYWPSFHDTRYDPDMLEGWSKEILLMFEQLHQSDLHYRSLTQELSGVAWSKTSSHWWPILLAAALALRIVKIDAEIRMARENEGTSPRRSQKASLVSRTICWLVAYPVPTAPEADQAGS